MTNITVQYKDEKVTLPVNNNGILQIKSLKKHFPKAKGLIYEDETGQIHTLAATSGKILINADIKEYNLYVNEVSQKTNGVPNELKNEMTKKRDSDCEEPVNSNGSSSKPISKRKTSRFHFKTLRVGWLYKSPSDKKYQRVKKPLSNVIRLKLDESQAYTASEIKSMAIKRLEYENENFVFPDKFDFNLGFFGGQVIYDFKLRNEIICDVWNYCKFKKVPLYNLNVFLLSTPKNPEEDPFASVPEHKPEPLKRTRKPRKGRRRLPKVKDNLRIFYHYSRTSKYSEEVSHTECEKPDLHVYFLENNYGEGPTLEEFDPLEYGHTISRIERDDKVYLQIHLDERSKRSFDFPSAEKAEPHAVAHDTDELQGVYDGKLGIGFVPSCTDACRPSFEWFRDGQMVKKGDFLYWMGGVKSNFGDKKPHVWHCVVKCNETQRELRSKDVLVK